MPSENEDMATSQAPLIVPSGYLTLGDTLTELGKSVKTVERLVASGDLESKLIPREGRKPERVYSAAAVARLKSENDRRRERRQATVPATRQIPAPPRITSLAIPPDTITTIRDAMSQFLASPPVRITDKLWLTLKEARAYSGLGRKDLLDLAEAGEIQTRKSGRRRLFRRASLEAFQG